MRSSIILLLLGGFFFSCAPVVPGKPAWLITEKDLGIDEKEWWLAAASSENREGAIKAAERKLKARLLQWLLRSDSSVGTWGDGSLTEVVENAPLTILREFQSSPGGFHAVLVGLKKSSLVEGAKQLARKLVGQEEEECLSSRELFAQGQAGESLWHAIRACLASCKLERIERFFSVDSGGADNSERLKRQLVDVFRLLRLKLIRVGIVPTEGGRKAALVVGAFLEKEDGVEPAAGLPLEVVNRGAEVRCKTSEIGICQLEIEYAEDSKAVIRVGPIEETPLGQTCPCLQELVSAAPVLEVPLPAASRAKRRLLLLVRARGTAEAWQREMFELGLSDAVLSRGFELVPVETAVEVLALYETLEEALPEIANLADRVLVLDVLFNPGPGVGGRLFFCHAKAALRLIETVGPKTLFSWDKARKAAGSAVDKACRRAAALVLTDINHALKNFLDQEKP